MAIFAIPEITELILNKCTMRELFRFEAVSRYYAWFIRTCSWNNVPIRITDPDVCPHVLTKYKFVNFDVSKTDIDDLIVNLLTRCRTLNLSLCKHITNQSIILLGQCQNLNLSLTRTTDQSVKYLSQCQKLNLFGTNVTDCSMPYLTRCSELILSDTKVTERFGIFDWMQGVRTFWYRNN